MNKSELIEALATKAELSKAAAGRAVDVLVEEIVTAVAKGRFGDTGGLWYIQVGCARGSRGQEPENRRENQDRCNDGAEVLCGRYLQTGSRRQSQEEVSRVGCGVTRNDSA
jgi:hypothetical protein